jgi:predicted ribosomally synthesized peptide with nif11-like leader
VAYWDGSGAWAQPIRLIPGWGCEMMEATTTRAFPVMSEEQLSALLAKLKEDAGLQEKLKGAADLDTALAIAKEAGFEVSKADWVRRQAKQTLEMSDEELEGVSGGNLYSVYHRCGPTAILVDGRCW